MACVCPACGGTAAEHEARGQQSLERCQPHEWRVAGAVDVATMLHRCLQCGVTVRVPVGARGETLRAYWRSAGECPGMRE